MTAGRPVTILIADDDPEDRMLARDALSESKLANAVQFVEDGQGTARLPAPAGAVRGSRAVTHTWNHPR